jgi:hypothetical protein
LVLMAADTPDTLMRTAAFEHVRRLSETHDHLTAIELKPGFMFRGDRIPLTNPQRGIFKPQQMSFLLLIKIVFPKPGGKVWYDDQRDVHRQIAVNQIARHIDTDQSPAPRNCRHPSEPSRRRPIFLVGTTGDDLERVIGKGTIAFLPPGPI